jgi:N-acetylneuraminate synthase
MTAISRGIDLLEVHVTFDRRMFGPDAEASLTVDELGIVTDHRDAVHEMDANPIDKDEIADSLSENRALFSKSIAPTERLPAGMTLTEDVLTAKKPGTGIPYEKRDRVIGKTLEQEISPRRLVTWDDINGT